jgi:hypothetical protein
MRQPDAVVLQAHRFEAIKSQGRAIPRLRLECVGGEQEYGSWDKRRGSGRARKRLRRSGAGGSGRRTRADGGLGRSPPRGPGDDPAGAGC